MYAQNYFFLKILRPVHGMTVDSSFVPLMAGHTEIPLFPFNARKHGFSFEMHFFGVRL
jgi:hypothetical protein